MKPGSFNTSFNIFQLAPPYQNGDDEASAAGQGDADMARGAAALQVARAIAER
jgi:hypothetical protein